jgi:hypothetical protein
MDEQTELLREIPQIIGVYHLGMGVGGRLERPSAP